MARTPKITSEIAREIANGTNTEYLLINIIDHQDDKLVLIMFSKSTGMEYEVTVDRDYHVESVVATGETWTMDDYIQAKRTADTARRLYLKLLGN